jgi:diaminopimelate decarboxylase
MGNPMAPAGTAMRVLWDIAQRYGTPTYAYDVERLRSQAARLRANLPQAVDILYSLKANASLGISSILARCGLGADVASAGELVTAVAAGFPAERIFVAGPYKAPEVLDQVRSLPGAVLSIDSASELRTLAGASLPNRAVLRLRPDFDSCATVSAGQSSRFGVLLEELPGCREVIASGAIRVIGFHVFSGSQMLDSASVIQHLRGALDLSLRAADRLGIVPEVYNLGGGFGTPYGPEELELDLVPIGKELATLAGRAAPARLVLELGRYLVAQAGWYLTTVVGHQTHRGRPAVVVDGGTHQRADLCGLGLRTKALPPWVPTGETGPLHPTDVLGCLSLPADVLAESCPLPALAPGTVLAFPNAGAYGLWASPTLFHGQALPAEAAFDGATIHLMRARQPTASILEGQTLLVATSDSRSVP